MILILWTAIADAWNKDRGDVTIEYRAIVRGVMPELAALLDALIEEDTQ